MSQGGDVHTYTAGTAVEVRYTGWIRLDWFEDNTANKQHHKPLAAKKIHEGQTRTHTHEQPFYVYYTRVRHGSAVPCRRGETAVTTYIPEQQCSEDVCSSSMSSYTCSSMELWRVFCLLLLLVVCLGKNRDPTGLPTLCTDISA